MPVIDMSTIDPTSDVTTTTTLLHEVIPLTGTIISGTYGTFPTRIISKTTLMECFNQYTIILI